MQSPRYVWSVSFIDFAFPISVFFSRLPLDLFSLTTTEFHEGSRWTWGVSSETRSQHNRNAFLLESEQEEANHAQRENLSILKSETRELARTNYILCSLLFWPAIQLRHSVKGTGELLDRCYDWSRCRSLLSETRKKTTLQFRSRQPYWWSQRMKFPSFGNELKENFYNLETSSSFS